MDFLYLDNNATTQPAPEVVVAMDEVNRDAWANPSSIHRLGQVARQRIELARRALASLVGARPRQLTLTGSGTEALDLAIRGGLRARISRRTDPVSILTTRAEHSAVRELAADLERFGLDGTPIITHWAPMTPDGIVDAAAVEQLLATDPTIALVSIQWANNETGAIQPVQRIAQACRSRPPEQGGISLFHCDATQWVGKRPATFLSEPIGGVNPPESLLADFITFSAHKFHGPKGLGILWTRPGVRFAPMILGEQELGRRGGTENTAAIVGAGVAATLAADWLKNPQNIHNGRLLRDRFESAVLAAAKVSGVEASINGPISGTNQSDSPANSTDSRLWNTTNIAFPRLEAEALLLLLSERGVCCSAGAACSSGSLEPSSVLIATGIPPEKAHGSLRFSLSRNTTADEVDRAAAIIGECVARLRSSAANLL